MEPVQLAVKILVSTHHRDGERQISVSVEKKTGELSAVTPGSGLPDAEAIPRLRMSCTSAQNLLL